MKKIFTFVLVVGILQILVFAIPFTASAATSGTCGDGVTWSLDNSVLTISGKGKMYYSAYCAPWGGENSKVCWWSKKCRKGYI